VPAVCIVRSGQNPVTDTVIGCTEVPGPVKPPTPSMGALPVPGMQKIAAVAQTLGNPTCEFKPMPVKHEPNWSWL
jgi:hypothetical protein